MSQNFGNLREQYGTGGLQRRSAVSAWLVAGLVLLAFAGFMVARSAADTSAYGSGVGNPVHNSQCPSSSSLAADSGCPRAEAASEAQELSHPLTSGEST